MGELGVYLYAVGRSPLGPLDPDVPSLGGPLRTVDHDGLTVVVSDVPLDEFGEEPLHRNLEDLGWLEHVARTHYAVVEAAARHGPVAPLRLATICLADASVRARVDQNRAAIEQVLEQVAGRYEWSVKAYISAHEDRPGAASGFTAGVDDSPAPTSGAAYLMRRRAALTRRDDDLVAAAHLADQLHVALSGPVVGNCLLAPQDRRLSGHEGTMILNAAYLVDAGAEERFLDVVARLRDTHPDVRIEERGPWTPYSFSTLDPA